MVDAAPVQLSLEPGAHRAIFLKIVTVITIPFFLIVFSQPPSTVQRGGGLVRITQGNVESSVGNF